VWILACRIIPVHSIEESFHAPQDILSLDQTNTVFCAKRATAPSMGTARTARQFLLDNHCSGRIWIKTQGGCSGAEDSYDGDPPRNRNVHRPTIVGNKNIAPVNGRGQFPKINLSYHVYPNVTRKVLDFSYDVLIFRAAEKQDLTAISLLQTKYQIRISLCRPSFGPPDGTGVDTERHPVTLDSERAENALHSFPGARVHFNPRSSSALPGIYAEWLK
jgi:hypothetical protein